MSDENTQVEPAQLTPEQKLAEWKKICLESNGARILISGLPIGERAAEFQTKLEAHIKRTKEYNRLNVIHDNDHENFFFALRMAFEEAGMEDVWEKNLAFDNTAKKDGLLVINVSEPMPGMK